MAHGHIGHLHCCTGVQAGGDGGAQEGGGIPEAGRALFVKVHLEKGNLKFLAFLGRPRPMQLMGTEDACVIIWGNDLERLELPRNVTMDLKQAKLFLWQCCCRRGI